MLTVETFWNEKMLCNSCKRKAGAEHQSDFENLRAVYL